MAFGRDGKVFWEGQPSQSLPVSEKVALLEAELAATQIYGAWSEMGAVQALSHQRMSLDAAQLAHYWRRCSLSSDFWAHYTALFVPEPPPSGRLPRIALDNLLSYMLNELFENCAKFSGGPVGDVCYEAWIQPDGMIFQVTNHIEPERQASFTSFIEELLGGDPEELYFRRLEENAETDSKGSGLGYLTLMKDYGVRFGFRFQPKADGSIAVDVQAHVRLEES
jgi:hypothetical protein